jgi:Flp pilus assembly protein TadG
MKLISKIWPFGMKRHRLPGRALVADTRGNIMVLMALALPVLLGMLGIAVEAGHWYLTKRDMQNAADAAVIAASTNGATGAVAEAKAVTARYGYTDGAGDTTIAVSTAASCPGGGSNCYSVTVTRKLAQSFSLFTGFDGGSTIGTRKAISLNAVAVASVGTVNREYCILALDTSGDAFRLNGAPNANLAGCNVMSNANMRCNGHDSDADIADAVGTNSGCGNTRNSGVAAVSDPYSSRASAIPANTCSSYPTTATGGNLLSGSYSWTGNQSFCGNVKLTGNVTLTGSNTVIVIQNGGLNLNGFTLATASGSTATIVFSGTAGAYAHTPSGSGTLDIQAPTSGNWSGIAMYQDPALTTNVDISFAGNSPTWNITGLVYMPKAAVTFSGAVNKSSYGASCVGFVIKSMLVNGTANIISQGACAAAGLTLPTNSFPGRGALVA